MTIEQMRAQAALLAKSLKLTDVEQESQSKLEAKYGGASADYKHDKPIRAEINSLTKAIADVERKAALKEQETEERQEAKATVTEAPASTLGDAMGVKPKKAKGPGPKPTDDPGEGMEYRVIDTGDFRGPRWLKRKKKNEQEASHNPGKHSKLAGTMKGNRSYA